MPRCMCRFCVASRDRFRVVDCYGNVHKRRERRWRARLSAFYWTHRNPTYAPYFVVRPPDQVRVVIDEIKAKIAAAEHGQGGAR